MSQIRRFASQYVSQHLNGLSVSATIDAASAVIATHSGSFHCDEALACGLLRHLPLYHHASVVRTRDPELIDRATIVVDVGAVYNHETLRYDHHQSSFHDTMTTPVKTYRTRLSSAGLVYRHYGKEIIRQYIHDILSSSARDEVLQVTQWGVERTDATDGEISIVYDAMYRGFVEAVDAIDCGVDMFRMEARENATVGQQALELGEVVMKRNYSLGSDLAGRIKDMQPWWNAPDSRNVDAENGAFVEAVELAAREFFQALSFYAFSWLPGRTIVQKAFDSATEVHPSGKIIVFSSGGCPWKEHLFTLEKEHNKTGHVLYAIFADRATYRIQAVPLEANGFTNRKPLPFKGLRDDDLSNACGIPGGIFVHVSGFIGGFKTYEGALQFAVKAIEAPVE